MKDLLVKVGKTLRDSAERAKELTRATGVPGKYHVLVQEVVWDVDYAERLVHERLAAYRLQPNREFFQVPYEVAIRTVIATCMEVNRERDISRSSNIRRIRLMLTEKHKPKTLQVFLAPFRRMRGRKVDVEVSFKSKSGAACGVLLGTNWRVVLSPYLIAELQAWLGKEGIMFATTPADRRGRGIPF